MTNEQVQIIEIIAGALASTASIIAAIKAWRSASASKETKQAVAELTALIQKQEQRQVQSVNINLNTAGKSESGGVIDFDPKEYPPEREG